MLTDEWGSGRQFEPEDLWFDKESTSLNTLKSATAGGVDLYQLSNGIDALTCSSLTAGIFTKIPAFF